MSRCKYLVKEQRAVCYIASGLVVSDPAQEMNQYCLQMIRLGLKYVGLFQCEYSGDKIYWCNVGFLGKVMTSVHRYEQDKH
jgi:hypothetical protein